MSQSFKLYRRNARTVTRQLLIQQPNEVVAEFIQRINASINEAQVSIVLADVRQLL